VPDPPKKTPAPAPNPQAQLNRAIRETATDMAKNAVFEKRPYLKLAFANPYNLSLLLGGVTASLLTGNPIPGLMALGGEALWLLHGSAAGESPAGPRGTGPRREDEEPP
jgi:hypothetical protein